MKEIKIENGQLATFKNGVSFVHENKTFDLVEIVGGSPYLVSIVTLKRGSETTKRTFSRLMENLIKTKGEKFEVTFYPIQQVGKGKYSKYGKDHSKEIMEGIELFKEVIKGHGIRTTVKRGNDSPRGGQLGEFIKVSVLETEKRKTERISEEVKNGEYVVL